VVCLILFMVCSGPYVLGFGRSGRQAWDVDWERASDNVVLLPAVV